MKTENIYIQQLTDNLKKINPHLIILFGSYANGTAQPDSDIDLMVVTNDNYFPGSFKENTNLYLSVNSQIKEIVKKVPVDLLVYTLPMYKQFIHLESSFSREVLTNGIILYESNN